MKNKYLVLIGCLIVLMGCSSTKNSSAALASNSIGATFSIKYLYTDSNSMAHFESEKYVSNALNSYTISKINKQNFTFLKCTKEAIVNRHDSTVTDTVYNFLNSTNKIQIYRSNTSDIIFTFDVTSSKLSLSENVKPGMSKQNFVKKFRIDKPLPNTVQIANAEGTMRLRFYFINDKLVRIISYLYLD
jgi:hypothetical protein